MALTELYREGARLPVQPRVLLRYAGLLAGAQRSMAGLQTMLADALGAPVRGAQAPGRWLALEPRFQTALGARLGRNHALGVDTVLGARAWDACGAIVLEIGPLDVARFCALQPGGAAYELLVFITRFYLREELDVAVELRLSAVDAEVRALARLNPDSGGPLRPGARLARSAWLFDADAAGAAPAPQVQHRARYMLPHWRAGQPQSTPTVAPEAQGWAA